jgi:hypothetical protein
VTAETWVVKEQQGEKGRLRVLVLVIMVIIIMETLLTFFK